LNVLVVGVLVVKVAVVQGLQDMVVLVEVVAH